MNLEPTCVDLFCGAGLMSEGFKQAGFCHIFAADKDARAVSTYNKNHIPVAQEWDVSLAKQGLRADVLVAGPPCQGFSSLGKRDRHDVRNKLSLALLPWIEQLTPSVVIIENVVQFRDSQYWTQIKNWARPLGYEAYEWELNAVDYGAAQRRRRAFCILSRIGKPAKPDQQESALRSVRDAFYGLPLKPDSHNFHTAPEPSALAAQRMALIPPQGDKRDLMRANPAICPPSWARVGNQATDVWGRMDFDAPANTIRCSFQNPSKGRYLHPTEDRVITLREGARLQGIPDNWEFVGDRTSIARQIGNGVPVPLAHAVAKSIMRLFKDETHTLSSATLRN